MMTPPSSRLSPRPAHKSRTCVKWSLPVCLGQPTASSASFLRTQTLPPWSQMASLHLPESGPEHAADSAILMPSLFPSPLFCMSMLHVKISTKPPSTFTADLKHPCMFSWGWAEAMQSFPVYNEATDGDSTNWNMHVPFPFPPFCCHHSRPMSAGTGSGPPATLERWVVYVW